MSEDILELKAAISVATVDLLRHVQDLVSQSQGRAASWDDTLKAMAKLYVQKKDPVERAQRILKKQVEEAQKN